MAHVITGACVGCKHTLCAQECPTDSFHVGETMLYIDPTSCIDCELCPQVCPEGAIFIEDDVPEDQKKYIAINAESWEKFPNFVDS